MKELGLSIESIKSDWRNKNYSAVIDQSRVLLRYEPDNIYGLIYLSRAAPYTAEWNDVITSGASLVDRSPRDAFAAARKLNRAGHAMSAAEIFLNLKIDAGWFDAKVADLASKEGLSLLQSGLASEKNDIDAAKIFWKAGLNIAPHNQSLRIRIGELARDVRQTANRLDVRQDPTAYLKAWGEVLWFNPADSLAATKVARATEREDEQGSTFAWLKVLQIDPAHTLANERLRKLVGRHDLEDQTIRALAETGRDETTDSLMQEMASNRDIKARTSLNKMIKTRLRNSLTEARAVSPVTDPRLHLDVWKTVLVLNPHDLSATRKVISSANRLGDHSELVGGLIAHLELTPGDTVLAQRLATAALRAGQEARALECLARLGLVDLSVTKIYRLQQHVLQACKDALSSMDFDYALTCFHALELSNPGLPAVKSLRQSLAKKAAAGAKESEKQGNLGVAIPLAEKVLDIMPNQPTALTIVARDLWRHKRFSDLISTCEIHVRPTPEYASLQKLLDRAAEKVTV